MVAHRRLYHRPLFKRSSSTQLIKYRYNASLRKRELDLRRASPPRHILPARAPLSEKRMTSITVRAEFVQPYFKWATDEMFSFRINFSVSSPRVFLFFFFPLIMHRLQSNPFENQVFPRESKDPINNFLFLEPSRWNSERRKGKKKRVLILHYDANSNRSD